MTDSAVQFETIQTASMNPHPSTTHDISLATTASQKEPVTIKSHHHRSPSDATSISTDIVDPRRAIRRVQRTTLPPLPDLRFEQSYLASLKGAETWQKVAWITLRDQVCLPLMQGTLWTLALAGWRYWNRGTQFKGRTLGTRIRRWWWEVNNWKIPEL
ncbi:DUF1770 superfamily domain-containing protein [Histoplasma ohiense]|nr:DUF1770 superfamily domain-containing protein [Histoplasma ohiense (nom. inval.)]